MAWYPRLREGPLDLRLRYLAYVRASQLNRCRYCVTHNGAAGRRAGIPREQLETLADYRTSPLFSELERRVIAYAEAMTIAVHADPRDVPLRRLAPDLPGAPASWARDLLRSWHDGLAPWPANVRALTGAAGRVVAVTSGRPSDP